jgi:D-alanyl-D-alanine carboxypeptidase
MLRAAAAPGGAVLRACLPVAGQSGTLAERFHGTELVGRVRAKTGWIRGASALSGMVEGKDGTVRWFAILMNYDPKQDGRNKDLKRLQEQIVQVIERMPVGA